MYVVHIWSCSSFFRHCLWDPLLPGSVSGRACLLTILHGLSGSNSDFCRCKWTHLFMSRLISNSPFCYKHCSLLDSMQWTCIGLRKLLLLCIPLFCIALFLSWTANLFPLSYSLHWMPSILSWEVPLMWTYFSYILSFCQPMKVRFRKTMPFSSFRNSSGTGRDWYS